MAEDDPLRGSVQERREAARKRPFYAYDAMAAYAERTMLWTYLSCVCLIVFALGSLFVPRDVRPLALHIVLEYPAVFGLWMSIPMLLVCSFKAPLAWVFSMQQFGRDLEKPFLDHGLDFDLIDSDPTLKGCFDPPAPLFGRLLRPFLTPSNAETLAGLLVASFMTLGHAANDPLLSHLDWLAS
jgi:hypothetical protein